MQNPHLSRVPRQSHCRRHWRQRGAPPPDPQHHRSTPQIGTQAPTKAETIACWLILVLPTLEEHAPRPHLPGTAAHLSRRRPTPTLNPASPPPRPAPLPASPESGEPRCPKPQGPHCEALVLPGGLCANWGQICEASNISRGLLAKWFFTLWVF
jgi:hypothetical protein